MSVDLRDDDRNSEPKTHYLNRNVKEMNKPLIFKYNE